VIGTMMISVSEMKLFWFFYPKIKIQELF